MKEIDGKTHCVRALLESAKYGVDYYQREYKWQTKQMAELISDLTSRFLDDYDDTHSRKNVAEYGYYFLGSIIVCEKEGQHLIVDGQQRLTSLTLLLIFLHSLQKGRGDAVQIERLIFSEKFGDRSFNMNVPDRNDCMTALFEGRPYDPTNKPESVTTLLERYQDIEQIFPEELREKPLPYFIEWLLEKVHLVKITAYADEDAYTIFETMNDRGLSLSATDMLKGYLLANIENAEQRQQADKTIKHWLNSFAEHGKETESDFFKTWLRARYAKKQRERKKNAKPGDFDLIGTEYHRWVRDQQAELGLQGSDNFNDWIQNDLNFYASEYVNLLKAAKGEIKGLEEVSYNADHGFTQQFQMLLAPLKPIDSKDVIQKKLKLVACYVDSWINRRLWNFKSMSYSTVQYGVFERTKEIREHGDTVESLKAYLVDLVQKDSQELNFDTVPYLNSWNSKSLHRQLARFTDWLERQSDQPGRYRDYIVRSGKMAYETEHIWADKYTRYKNEFEQQKDFDEHRNKIGCLLILPKKVNGSLNDAEYSFKLTHYIKENVLAKSLHEDAYKNNPGFVQAIRKHDLPFKPHADFTKKELEERNRLYSRLAKTLWSVDRLQEVA